MNSLDTLRWADEIRELKARYFRLMDAKCWDDYATLFLDDSVFDVSEAFNDPESGEASGMAAAVSEPIIGQDAIVAYVSRGLNARVRSFHIGFMPEIEILSETRARAVWAMEDRVWLPDSPVAQMHGWGHYHETYTRRDGRWHIQTLKITRIRVEFVPRESPAAA
ncbi:nuclear transport factor 2 family protein [Trinickia violacea]|uniref:Nuclear transport factor 2 family protein n=1 Tax=Trinickia violacea TaxID=2571746 RepID=A0A4P8ISW3_9BURK|nr:nuclear transport factor 2 family protein [Trinickia violacea]QCP50373.1 nuclear transport factor 2 family protein [Trinickia violacea]